MSSSESVAASMESSLVVECRICASRARVIASSASCCEESGMMATSLIEYTGLPLIKATCSRLEIEMRKEEDATCSSPIYG